ncbi:hypothetical protein FSP39_020557 [Pinctada imbricata]|uniref:Structure-specific endonuclease subunit SLX4 n=1 Tax=Pinctada imbricata TaxID=66713 RepID=A0AA88Y955_PINIB|nr:hypothetical protein FSP39_020557 [Pinctada imbricata]
MDKAQRESKEDTNSTNKKKPEILECPICGKKLKTVQARRVHMKKCAVTYNVSTEQVIKLAQKQEEEKNILAALNEPSESERLKLEELTEACDTLMLSGAEVQSDSDEEDEKLKEIRNVDNVFSDDSEKERTRAEEELITEADEISDDDYFDIMLTQREKLRKLSEQSDQRKDGKVSHDGVGRIVSRYNIGDATQREISLFFRNGLNSDSSSDEDVSEAKRHKLDHPDVDGSQYLLKSSERPEENDDLHLCMNSMGSSSSQVLNIEKLKSDGEPRLSPSKKQRTRNTGRNSDKPCDLLTTQTSSVNMSSDIIEIGSSGDSNSLDGITIPAETEMNLSRNCQKNISQQRKSIEGNMSFVEHTNYKSPTSKSRDLNSPDMEMDLSGADLFGSPSPAASSNRSSPVVFPEREDAELTQYKHLGENSNQTPHKQRRKEIDITPHKHLRDDTVLTPKKIYTENSNIHVTPHKQFDDDTNITPHKQFNDDTNITLHKECRDSNPSSPDQVMEILSSPEHVTEVQDYPDHCPSYSPEKEEVVNDRTSCSIDNRKYSGICIFKRNANMINDDSNDEYYHYNGTDRKNCDIDRCDISVKPSDNTSPIINEHVTNSPKELIANTSPKFKPREGKRFRFQRKVLIVPKDDDDDDDEAYCSQIADKPFIQDSEKGQKVTSKGKGRASAGKLSMSPVYQPSTSREQEGGDREGIYPTDLTMSPVYHQPNSSCPENGVRTGPTKSGEMSPLEEDVWEDFEDDGGMGDVVIMDSPERNAGSSTETPKYTVIRSEENINDVSDLPDIPEAHDVEEFSDSFVVPDNDNIHIDKQESSSDVKKDFKTPVSIRGGIHKGQRTQKDPSKVWMPPSPFTPMPDYDKMATPILKREVQRYGVKPIPKKKMIVVLKDIYQKMHEYETDSELEISKESVDDDDNDDVGKIDDKRTGDDSEDDDINCSQESSNSCTSDLIEESFMQTEETELPASQQPKGDLKEKFTEFIEKRNDIYNRILMYEPLELDWLKKELTDAGVKTSMDKLMNFLDEKCITFTMKNRRNNSPRKRRGRKKKEESTNK